MFESVRWIQRNQLLRILSFLIQEHSMAFHSLRSYSSSLLCVVSVIRDQWRSKYTKQNVPEISNSCILNCMPFWVTWWNLTPCVSIVPGHESFCGLAHPCCGHYPQVSRLGAISVTRWPMWITELVFKGPSFCATVGLEHKKDDLATWVCPRKAIKCFLWGKGWNSNKMFKEGPGAVAQCLNPCLSHAMVRELLPFLLFREFWQFVCSNECVLVF